MSSLEKANILIVNDRIDQLTALEVILTPLDQELVMVNSGEQALLLLLNNDFAVILLDVKMPGMDGFETATLIRTLKRNASTPIIFVTAAQFSPADQFAGYSLGAVDYIFTPIAPEILRAKVHALIELYQKTLQVRSQAESLKIINDNLTKEIIKREHIEHILQEKNIELENAQRAKDRFLTSMSHELRTPLNAIIGFTGTLLMKLPGPLTLDQDKQLKTVQTSAKHLLTLINDLLDLAKLGSGDVTIKLNTLNCHNALNTAVTSLQPLASKKGLKLFIKPFPSEWLLQADPLILQQILLNLINNAIKFTDTGSVSLEVEKRQVEDKIWLAIHVLDTGIGIKSEDQSRLFQPFEPLHNLPNLESTGLGLHLSQKYAALLNGNIEYQSVYHQGSRFTLVCPSMEI